MWTELDGDDLVINTALGRAKARNLASDGRVAVSIVDPDDDQTIITLRGSVVGFTTIGADEVSDRLAMKYMGVDIVAEARRRDPRHGEDPTRPDIEPARVAQRKVVTSPTTSLVPEECTPRTSSPRRRCVPSQLHTATGVGGAGRL